MGNSIKVRHWKKAQRKANWAVMTMPNSIEFLESQIAQLRNQVQGALPDSARSEFGELIAAIQASEKSNTALRMALMDRLPAILSQVRAELAATVSYTVMQEFYAAADNIRHIIQDDYYLFCAERYNAIYQADGAVLLKIEQLQRIETSEDVKRILAELYSKIQERIRNRQLQFAGEFHLTSVIWDKLTWVWSHDDTEIVEAHRIFDADISDYLDQHLIQQGIMYGDIAHNEDEVRELLEQLTLEISVPQTQLISRQSAQLLLRSQKLKAHLSQAEKILVTESNAVTKQDLLLDEVRTEVRHVLQDILINDDNNARTLFQLRDMIPPVVDQLRRELDATIPYTTIEQLDAAAFIVFAIVRDDYYNGVCLPKYTAIYLADGDTVRKLQDVIMIEVRPAVLTMLTELLAKVQERIALRQLQFVYVYPGRLPSYMILRVDELYFVNYVFSKLIWIWNYDGYPMASMHDLFADIGSFLTQHLLDQVYAPYTPVIYSDDGTFTVIPSRPASGYNLIADATAWIYALVQQLIVENEK